MSWKLEAGVSPEAKTPRFAIAKLLGIAATSASLLLLTAENTEAIHDEYVARSDVSQLSKVTSAIASELLQDTVRINCDTALINAVDVPDDTFKPIAYVRSFKASVPFTNLEFRKAPHTIHSRETLCCDLVNFEQNAVSKPTTPQGAAALLILFHEYEQVQGVKDGAKATCFALQKSIGYLTDSDSEPTDLATAIRLEKERVATIPKNYRSAECRAGGALDLRISDVYIN